MADLPVRKIAIAGVLSAVAIVLGITRLGFIPWFSGASITIMHVPVIVAAILEGPIVGAIVGLLFGVFSLLQAAIAPTGPVDVAFTNPLISVLPRLLVGPAAWIVWRLIEGKADSGRPFGLRSSAAVLVGAVAGSATNTGLVLSGLGLFNFFPWPLIGTVAVANGIPEAAVAALVTFAIVGAWKRFPSGGGRSRLSREEE